MNTQPEPAVKPTTLNKAIEEVQRLWESHPKDCNCSQCHVIRAARRAQESEKENLVLKDSYECACKTEQLHMQELGHLRLENSKFKIDLETIRFTSQESLHTAAVKSVLNNPVP